MFKFLTFEKGTVLIKSYFESQFKYCPLVWIFYGRKVNNKIDRLHDEGALKMVDEVLLRLTLSWKKICHFLSMIEMFNYLHWKCTK